ncbi:hypothetical protein NEMBOFW57_006741 [Staphylotrichum longicolle]|uniref:Uncharacterized protein n=1 Tax=Staphylotrichum longicolle TaxID=669026 RepID=A0AAD4HYC5_9PEZI|nr:hypothetical protein NEMBOFW57_006741 [Staphylotrichum longicolle]
MSSPSSIDFNPEWIWGDDAETTVYAQGYSDSGQTVIFTFRLSEAGQAPDGLANRICTSFHLLEADGGPASHTFPNSTAMREALWDAVRIVWPRCLQDPAISEPDAVVNIDSRDGSPENITWAVQRHPLFPRYVRILGEKDGE